MINSRDVDVICISETLLIPLISDNWISIHNYTVYRKDKGRGGGVCMYVKNTLKSNKITLNDINHPGIEDIYVTIQRNKLPSLIIACIYRHPKATSDSFDYLNSTFQLLCLSKKSFYIFGDLNEDLNSRPNRLSKIIDNNKLCQLIDKPTRITEKSRTLLDVLITNNSSLVTSHEVLPLSIGDHELISAKLNLSKPKKERIFRTFRQLTNYSNDNLCSALMAKLNKLKISL